MSISTQHISITWVFSSISISRSRIATSIYIILFNRNNKMSIKISKIYTKFIPISFISTIPTTWNNFNNSFSGFTFNKSISNRFILFIISTNRSFINNTKNVSYYIIYITKEASIKISNFKSSFHIVCNTHTTISIIISKNRFNKMIMFNTIIYNIDRNI